MREVMVDSNVILDVASEDPAWLDWSAAQLSSLAEEHVLVINPIVYAEVSVGYLTIEELDRALPTDRFRRDSLPWAAAFLAGKCFERYRRSGGRRRSPRPDFYIGAHAAVEGMALVTRDASRYRTYFPRLRLIAP
jgi:predicted nucleic acid-binding protein